MNLSDPTDPPRILVTGATGTTGSRVVEALSALGHPAVQASRSTAVGFRWNDPATHDRVLDGIEAAYLVPPTDVADPEPLMLAFIERALTRGVRRFVLLSSSAIPAGTPGVGRVHAALRESAHEWTVLRPSWFMQNFERSGHYIADGITARGRLATSIEDGRIAFVDADDIAAVAARALVDPAPHQTEHVITGPEALGYDDVARVLSGILGREIVHDRVDRQTVQEHMEDSGLPRPIAEVLAGLETALRDGSEDRVTNTVERVAGRPPRAFGAWAATRADAWRQPEGATA